MSHFVHSAVLLHTDSEKYLKLANELYEQGPAQFDTAEEVFFVLASWSVFLNSENAREIMRSSKPFNTPSSVASKIRGYKMWWLYPLLFILDLYFLLDLFFTNNIMRVNDLVLSSVKYKTYIYKLLVFKSLSFVADYEKYQMDTRLFLFHAVRKKVA